MTDRFRIHPKLQTGFPFSSIYLPEDKCEVYCKFNIVKILSKKITIMIQYYLSLLIFELSKGCCFLYFEPEYSEINANLFYLFESKSIDPYISFLNVVEVECGNIKTSTLSGSMLIPQCWQTVDMFQMNCNKKYDLITVPFQYKV